MSENGSEASVPADEEEAVGGGDDETSARGGASDSSESAPETPEPAGRGIERLFEAADTGRRRGGRAGATVISGSIRGLGMGRGGWPVREFN